MVSLPLVSGLAVGLVTSALARPGRTIKKIRPRRSLLTRFLLTLLTGSLSGTVAAALIHFALHHLPHIP